MPVYKKPASIIPATDKERLEKLYSYNILDTQPEEAFDKVAKLAAQIFDTPGAYVTFVDRDRVFFKADVTQAEENQVLRQDSLCSLAILEDQLTVFNDTHQIPDLLESPHVNCPGGIRFYAGAPLKTPEGYQLGTICVVDAVPRQTSEKQLKMLETLSSIVMDELEHRRTAWNAVRVQTDLMNITVHDLKGPASNIALLASLLTKKLAENGTAHLTAFTEKISLSVEDINQRLQGLLNLSKIENGEFELSIGPVDLGEVLRTTKRNFEMLAQQKKQNIVLSVDEPIVLPADKARLQEAFENLLSNAIKYSYSDTEIMIRVSRQQDSAIVEFKDHGQGLTEADSIKLFTKFARLSAVPTGKERSNGLGLSIVKTLIELHNGQVWAKSSGKDKGTTFFVALPLQRPDPAQATS